MNFFSKKDDDLLDERVRLTKIYLDQQKQENSELRKEHSKLIELSLRSRLMLDDQVKSVSSNEKLIASITDQIKGFENIIQTNQELINKYEDEINQLRGVKSTLLPTDFYLASIQTEEVQEVLEKIDENAETFGFKDLNGNFWQIRKKEEYEEVLEEPEESMQIDEISINISLNT